MDASDLLSNPEIRAALKKAAEDSNIGGALPKEQGGFIVRDSEGTLSVARWSQGTSNEIQPPICNDGKYEGKTIVGSFHTHPNVGPGWREAPSQADVNFVKNFPQTAGEHHFIITGRTIYHIDGDGNISESGRTSEILR